MTSVVPKMEYLRFAVRFTVVALLIAVIGLYCYLIYTGEVSPPDVRGLAEKVAPSIASGGSIALLVAVGICCLLAAVAPFIFAVRSGDPFTIVVSIVALILCFILLTASRTVIDVVLAAIVYFTSAFISVIVYSTDRIVMAITRGRTPPP